MSKQLTSVLTRLEALEKNPQLPSPSSDIPTLVDIAIDTKLSNLDSRVTAIDTSVSNLQNDSDSRLRSLENTLSAQTESLNQFMSLIISNNGGDPNQIPAIRSLCRTGAKVK